LEVKEIDRLEDLPKSVVRANEFEPTIWIGFLDGLQDSIGIERIAETHHLAMRQFSVALQLPAILRRCFLFSSHCP